MGWSIACVKNELPISKECEEAIKKLNIENYGENYDEGYEGYSVYDGKLSFNSDHMEHMDYMDEDDLQKVLTDHKVTGEVCFADVESCDGIFWGYRFEDGKFSPLRGVIVWRPVNERGEFSE